MMTADSASLPEAPVPPDEATLRAEEMVDRLSEVVGDLTSRTVRSIFTFVARAREEAEDIWAEAQAASCRE